MIVGLTGGIGSGKTTIAKEFESLGVPLFIADIEAKKVYFTNQEVRKQVIDLLGEQVYRVVNGKEELNREFIAQKVFQSKELLAQLNAIIHPAVREAFNAFIKKHEQAAYVIYEAAILLETGGHKNCDQVLLVTAPESVRAERVMNRDGVEKEEVYRRMANQWSTCRKMEYANVVLVNEDYVNISFYVKRIHQYFLKMIK